MLTFHIPDMHCDGCIRSLTKAVQAIDPSATLTADLESHRVNVSTTAPAQSVSAAFEDAGFDVEKAG